jgi:hypothetical protein
MKRAQPRITRVIAIGTPFPHVAVISFLAYGTLYMTSAFFQASGYAAPAFAVPPAQASVLLPTALLGTALTGVRGIAWAIPAGDESGGQRRTRPASGVPEKAVRRSHASSAAQPESGHPARFYAIA